ncbi:nuclease-related domain-containing protein [Nocardioides exalbidus]|uniref:nuclease-related domain-containing protein n=1 Tax=Nocardioides exalbidus TaxID=402596 RepID=UPI001FDF836B|nr:nuclease-related domain-containing protein [Nocardioides exalbidus]
MDDTTAPAEKQMRLRYAGTCRICDAALPAKTEAVYERETKTIRCVTHDHDLPEPDLDVDIGEAGSSARREFERRKAGREKRIRDKHPKLGGLILALSDDPPSTTAWDTGAVVEERLGGRLNSLQSEACRVLHDRRIPESRANIDHLAVTTTGVYVIDAKRYSGRPRLRVEGGLLRPRVERLIVGRRDCTKLVDGVLKQVDVVRTVVGDQIPVHGVLCFVDADWPLIGGAFTTRDVQVLWPKRLQSTLTSPGDLDVHAIERVHRELASALPSA